MAWPENYNLTKVYWKSYIDKYAEVYQYVYNQMKDLYSKEEALAAAVATSMIAFSKAAGMDMAGIITWDEKAVLDTESFKTFVEPKMTSRPTVDQPQTGGYQKQVGGFQKPKYDGPTELKGPVSEKQVSKIHEFLNDTDPKVSKIVSDALVALNVAAPEELSKQQASNIIQAGFDARPKKFYKK